MDKFSVIHLNELSLKVDLSAPLDISIPLRAGKENVNAWYVDPVEIEPVRTEQFTGSVKEGGSVNFRNIRFNPHGNGTHTECVGHIAEEVYSINQCLKTFFFLSELITVEPTKLENGDLVIDENHLSIHQHGVEALVIRTLPNEGSKIDFQYSNTNPPYLTKAAMKKVVAMGIKHLLIDLPSVDRELDEGILLGHRIFWNYPEAPRMNATITELIYVSKEIEDGKYVLNLQIASFENDASPSKPILYKIIN